MNRCCASSSVGSGAVQRSATAIAPVKSPEAVRAPLPSGLSRRARRAPRRRRLHGCNRCRRALDGARPNGRRGATSIHRGTRCCRRANGSPSSVRYLCAHARPGWPRALGRDPCSRRPAARSTGGTGVLLFLISGAETAELRAPCRIWLVSRITGKCVRPSSAPGLECVHR